VPVEGCCSIELLLRCSWHSMLVIEHTLNCFMRSFQYSAFGGLGSCSYNVVWHSTSTLISVQR
jgi:hypothetical protein